MALHSDAVATTGVQALANAIFTGGNWQFALLTGAAPADGNGALTGRTTLASWALTTSPVGTASNRQVSLATTQTNVLALANGNAGIGVLYQTGDDLTEAATPTDRRIIGTVGATGSGADFELAGGVAITANEPLSTSLVYRIPN